ncbi:MAG: mRNA interferase RelE/StbE [Euryarchaeota archaeon]|jgi:mRNA-degrading endonuclease RelE of RelBE toxin-antitoxin system|nr:mRNA interferase RelE/StbE [Euryarchaeota archaeon]
MQVQVHPRVKKYLDECGEKDRLKEGLGRLGEDPFTSKSGLDIKKLKGKTHDVYRLRIGEHRFEYFVEDGSVWVQNAFRRERGYVQGR